MSAVFETDNLCVQYGGNVALRNVAVSLEQGTVVGVVGESGSGKSTLLHAALDTLGPHGCISGGSVRFAGEEVLGMSPSKRRSYLNSVAAFISQNPQHAFSPVRTLGAQFEETALLRTGVTREEARINAHNLLGRLGIADPGRVLESYVFELSGGMAQRAAIALALMNSPKVLFADEPTSALDVVTQAQVAQELVSANRELGTALFVVSHNIAVLARMAQYLYVMKNGEVVEEGAAKQIVSNPQHPYTASLIAAVPRLGGLR